METIVLKNKKANIENLKKYGFAKQGEDFVFSIPICKNQFKLDIKVTNNILNLKLIEIETQDEYTLHLTSAEGEFVGYVRSNYKEVVNDMIAKCFDRDVFKQSQTKEIIDYIREKYNSNLEYLWEKFDNNAIWRREDNRKWFGVVMVISKKKLGLDSLNEVEVVDLRTDPTAPSVVDNKTIFEGYHMNKKSWITVCLDHSLSTSKLKKLIDQSFALAGKK